MSNKDSGLSKTQENVLVTAIIAMAVIIVIFVLNSCTKSCQNSAYMRECTQKHSPEECKKGMEK